MAPPVEPPTTITLRVKVPPGHIPGIADEFTLGNDIAVSLKIGQIRARLQEAIPSSPTPERQRLLYSGRALIDNDQTVADALNIRRDPTQNEYVVHLLVKGNGDATAPLPHRTGLNTTPTRSGSPATVPTPPGAPHLPPQQLHNPNAISPIQLQQPPGHAPPGFLPPGHAHPTPPQHLQQHQAAVLAQQQRMQIQMIQNAQQRALHTGLVPFGFQPMNFGVQGPVGMQGQVAPPGAPAVPHEGQNVGVGEHHQGDGQQDTAQQADGGSHTHPQSGEGQHAQHHPGLNVPPAPPRPLSEQGFHVEGVGPNGQRITIHQQTLQFPNIQMAAQHMPLGANMMPTNLPALGLPPLPGMPQHQQGQPQRPSALDQARDNIAEMRRVLTELRDMVTEEHREQIDRLEERTQAVNNYIDPLSLHGSGPDRGRGPVRMGPSIGGLPGGLAIPRTQTGPHLGQVPSWRQRARQVRDAQQALNQGQISTDANVTCYLLSSPSGPHALVYSPQHGTFTGQLPHHQSFGMSGLQPTPTTTVVPAGAAQDQGNQPGQANAAAQAPAQGQAAAAAARANLLGLMEPIMGHVWLLLRILIFSYFLLGTNMGWQRPLALLAIAGGFWMIRLGFLGDGGALRRWWEGIVQEGQQRAPAAQQPGADGQPQPVQQQNQDPAAPGQAARPAQMPTPAQVAQRLLDEEQRQRNANRDQRWQWVREQVRPAERALALLVASLWPGVGEAYVRAREQEARRLAEEEVAARRREEEERQRKEAEEKEKSEGEEKTEAIAEPTTTSDSASGLHQEGSGSNGAVQVDTHE
ncbi:hypothetical protein CLAFUW4_03742 [Fulvia fulva]|uniref:Ubiquitin-like domain-containing protein n=1 Tax=Passalora fulva TaxID=5499 RepID=A0A9Q8P4K1_PASFU|nr:uncharacterized protein CLAFUR5_03717 [Fulvia fulva]KAK4631926.1 hypothetical protein CLAFUR4_03730 [Fulvia fulva]KAK4633883.1 hypothetical protein CLAFUR0_03731 [Fulvia fulva]UJO13155.1 hypothetical protein CLAFUR5_03717 [Fulvia fulva]WPV11006.1 hypothetical protein CLAFUW4_03742 [Fulvia fulva]WPV26351.1 hypothetical protein CLAFUW7_03734 [Fulvia fulva]